jgi:hypothetical protein
MPSGVFLSELFANNLSYIRDYVALTAVEAGCIGGQGSPRAVVPSGREHGSYTQSVGLLGWVISYVASPLNTKHNVEKRRNAYRQPYCE